MNAIRRSMCYMIRPGSGVLRVRVRFAGHDVNVSTSLRVDRAKWDGRRCADRTSHFGVSAASINLALSEIEERVSRLFLNAEVNDLPVAPDSVRAAVRGDRPRLPDLWTSLDRFLIEGERRNQWAFNTVRSVRQVINLLRAFDPALSFESLTAEKLQRFVDYQHRAKLSGKNFANGQRGYSNASIAKNCRVVRWMLRWAAAQGYVPRSLETEFRPKVRQIERPVIFLRWDELMRLLDFPLEGDAARARDFFCFCCFTSLRYSDAHALRKSHVGHGVISVVTAKTAKPLRIELNKYSRAILERYADEPGEFALPRVSNDRLNKLLKEAGRAAGIDEPVSVCRQYGAERVETTAPKHEFLSSHCGRRTFICNALALGIAPSVVMKWTGHSEYSAMKPYIDIADDIRARSMALFDSM